MVREHVRGVFCMFLIRTNSYCFFSLIKLEAVQKFGLRQLRWIPGTIKWMFMWWEEETTNLCAHPLNRCWIQRRSTAGELCCACLKIKLFYCAKEKFVVNEKKNRINNLIFWYYEWILFRASCSFYSVIGSKNNPS